MNLSPADLPKEGSHYDLPIALGLLTVMGVLPLPEMASHMALGELSLDGAIIPVAGVLPAAIKALELERTFVCPKDSGPEAAWAGGLEIIAAPTLVALINHLKGVQVLSPPVAKLADEKIVVPDLRDVKGQETAKRALEIAAAGGHNLLMLGPPGAGKSMLAARLPGLLPPLDAREALEVSMIQSLAGELKNGAIGRRRPFRVMARQLYLALGGIALGAPASGEKSARTIRQWLAARRLSFPELVLENGSGLSRVERLSARSLARLLLVAQRSAVMPEFIASLPLVAVDGTMKKRLTGAEVAGQAHIKTGTLTGVRAIAGYVLDGKGRMMVVVCLINHARAPGAQAVQDALLQWVHGR